MITYKELLHGNMLSDVPIADQHNLEELLKRINVVRRIWGAPMIVTSGYRTWNQHAKIYSNSIPPKGSQHLIGCAVDIADPKGEIKAWLKKIPSVLEEAELYCEEGTEGWVHFQMNPPKSKKRWFNP